MLPARPVLAREHSTSVRKCSEPSKITYLEASQVTSNCLSLAESALVAALKQVLHNGILVVKPAKGIRDDGLTKRLPGQCAKRP